MLEACRRNNTELLQEVLHALAKSTPAKQSTTERVAQLLNQAVDGIGNHCLHLASTHGSCGSSMPSDGIRLTRRPEQMRCWTCCLIKRDSRSIQSIV